MLHSEIKPYFSKNLNKYRKKILFVCFPEKVEEDARGIQS